MDNYVSPNTALVGRDRAMITRSLDAHIRETFPFLQLPIELRFLIYNYAIDVKGIQSCLHTYYGRLRNCANAREIREVRAPRTFLQTPTVFQLNRQVYSEAIGFLSKHAVTFDHGLLDLADITDLAKPMLFRNISAITINDSGHPLFKENILSLSWLGYTVLITQLARMLYKGHKLQSFELSLLDPALRQHVQQCWDHTNKCGFRDTMKAAITLLGEVRGIGEVTIRGLPENVCEDLKTRMESTQIGFLDLPRELRDMIYTHCGDWNDVNQQMTRVIQARRPQMMPKHGGTTIIPVLSTPPILLLNHQISEEALPILRAKPLHITFPRLRSPKTKLSEFLPPKTLAHVKHLTITLHGLKWASQACALLRQIVAHVSGTFCDHTDIQRNPTTSLETLKIIFTDDIANKFYAGYYPDAELNLAMLPLRDLRGLRDVTFEGDLPTCYTEPLVAAMTAAVNTEMSSLPALESLESSGHKIASYAEEYSIEFEEEY